ncbi:hypothetical protein C0J52_14158 [Blattella germanica]|nr:hypothetical protein C0J52_14158 [Blattella germanica]
MHGFSSTRKWRHNENSGRFVDLTCNKLLCYKIHSCQHATYAAKNQEHKQEYAADSPSQRVVLMLDSCHWDLIPEWVHLHHPDVLATQPITLLTSRQQFISLSKGQQDNPYCKKDYKIISYKITEYCTVDQQMEMQTVQIDVAENILMKKSSSSRVALSFSKPFYSLLHRGVWCTYGSSSISETASIINQSDGSRYVLLT